MFYFLTNVYTKVVTAGQGTNRSVFYWWPPQDIFINSGMWLGYWSVDAENWYQKCVKMYREGTGQPRTATKWTRDLRQELVWTRNIFKRNGDVATTMLSGGTLPFEGGAN